MLPIYFNLKIIKKCFLHPSNMQIQNLKKYIEYTFPYKGHFAESLNVINNKVYMPLNNGNLLHPSGLYILDLNTNVWTLIFKFENKEIVLGSKISSNLHEWIGLATNLESMIVYNLVTHSYKLIKLLGYVNDICYDDTDANIVYVGTNVNYETYCGWLLKVNMTTFEYDIISKNTMNAICGICSHKEHIYCSTLYNVKRMNKKTYFNETIMENDPSKPYYDNIRVYNDKLNIAICTYNNTFAYWAMGNKYILKLINYLMSATIGIGYYDINNKNRKLIPCSEIMFATWDLIKETSSMICIQGKIPYFDSQITDMHQLHDNDYIFVNWVSNKIVKVKLI